MSGTVCAQCRTQIVVRTASGSHSGLLRVFFFRFRLIGACSTAPERPGESADLRQLGDVLANSAVT